MATDLTKMSVEQLLTLHTRFGNREQLAWRNYEDVVRIDARSQKEAVAAELTRRLTAERERGDRLAGEVMAVRYEDEQCPALHETQLACMTHAQRQTYYMDVQLAMRRTKEARAAVDAAGDLGVQS